MALTDGIEIPLGNLKTQLREAQKEVQTLADKFGATSEQAIKAAKKAADLKDRIGDAKDLTAAFNPDAKFKAFSQTLGAVAGGFSAVQGAIGLLGADSKDFEKTLLKVQSAMALSQGLEQLGGLGDAFKNLKAVAVNAFNGIKAAIGSTGIGLLVVALGAIYAYWDDIKAAVSGVSEEQKKLNKSTKENLKAQEEKLDAIDGQSNQLKLQGKSEKDILKLKEQQTDQAIAAAEINLANAKNTKNAQIEAAQRNHDILQNIIRGLTVPITLLLSTIDLAGKAFGKNFNLEQKFSGGISKMLFDPAATAKEGDATIKEAEATLNKLKEKRAGLQLSVKAIDANAAKEAKEKKKKTDDELEEERKKEEENQKTLAEDKARREDEAFKIQKDAYLNTLDERQKAQLKVEEEYEAKRSTLLRANITDFSTIEEEKRLALAKIKEDFDKKELEDKDKLEQAKTDIENKYIDSKLEYEKSIALTIEDKRLAELAQLEEDYNRKLALAQKNGEDITYLELLKTNKIIEINKTAADADKQIKKAKLAADIDLAMQTLSVLSGIVDKNSAAGKGIAVAQAVINTYQAASKAFAQGGVLGPVLGAVTIAAGLLNVKKIISTKVPSAKGSGTVGDIGGVTAPSMSGAAPITATQPEAQMTQLNQTSINAIGNQAIKAYVVETDMTTNQQRIKAIQQRARFG
jgi:hypothetical protein